MKGPILIGLISALICMIASIVMGFVAIWTQSGQWAGTAGLTFVVGLFVYMITMVIASGGF